MRIGIEGIGVIGGFGCGREAFERALEAGSVAAGRFEIRRCDETLQVDGFPAATDRLADFVPKRALRRIDHYSRMALLGAFLALEDAGRLEADRKRLGVVIATGYGATGTTFSFLDSVLDGGDPCASPTHFSSSVHNAAAANVSILLGATGPSLTVSQFEMSIPSALLTAERWLAEGRVDAVLFGGVDEYSDVQGYCWQRFFGSWSAESFSPLETGAQSAVPGEGAAFLLLTRGEETHPRYGTISAVEQGNLAGNPPALQGDAPLVLGAEGHARCAAGYRDLVPAGNPVACYTPLYGSLPVGMGFDLAAAALGVARGRLFPSAAAGEGWKSEGEHPAEGVACLKLGAGGDYGLVRIERG